MSIAIKTVVNPRTHVDEVIVLYSSSHVIKASCSYCMYYTSLIVQLSVCRTSQYDIIRPNKVKNMFLVLLPGQFLEPLFIFLK